ncbi:MAG TPA: RNA pseudouridine synthase [Spirochaetota bacterium]|nr:MAG: Ribosomal large subunit pseudouridine synthase D [Spirochaetes bacterium ADurb.Bin133]HNZ28035.1 RNA pseudouridine synthase [Spirochaetota bacterium]HPY88920.1 RNA pseudouridine synthase [Spirochaetota bacterium]
MQYTIAYEDEFLLVADKPQGVPVAPGKKRSLCEALFLDRPELSRVKGYKEKEGGLLNRLDNETGGLTLFAKSVEAFSYFKKLMDNENIEKFYKAIVYGTPNKTSGIIDYPIAHHYSDDKRMSILLDDRTKYRGKARLSKTEWEIVESAKNFSLLRIKITKGIRHQIRVHLSGIGHPILGDKLYCKKKDGYANHFLYSFGLRFKTMNGKEIKIEIATPFDKFVRNL